MRTLFIIVIVLGLIVGAYFVGRGGVLGVALPTTSVTAQGTPTAAAKLPAVKASGEVQAEGAVVPAKTAELSLAASGTVAEVLVAEGDRVKAGQTLVKLDSKRQVTAVNQAEATLSRAKASLGRAEATVARAQATLAQLKAGPRAEDSATARAALAVAQAELARTQKGPDEGQLITAKTNMEKAARAVQQAQFAYDRVKDAPFGNIGPEALRLEQATLDYEAAKAQYEVLQAGPREVDVNVAQARVVQAQAALAQAQAGARPEQITAAEADVAAAEADVMAVKADVRSAEAALAQARAALADMELKAPFDGTIITLNTKAGEVASPTSMAVRIADLSAWRIETTDLTELAVGRLKVGDPASLSFDAIPELKLSGKVDRISEFGKNRQGDIVYTVYIKPDSHEPRLRWNMTASVNIKPQ